MFTVSKRCYCAFCRSIRTVYSKRHVSMVDIFLAAFSSVLLSLAIWQDFDPRAVIFFALGLGFAEIFIAIRWRFSIACPHCGFDPVIYKKNPVLAAERVKRFMDQRREDPLMVFSPPPRLPVIVKKADQRTGSVKGATTNIRA